jgi:putative acetyltransferase
MTLHLDDVVIRDAAAGDERAVQRIVFEALGEYGLTPDPAGIDADLADLQAAYMQRGGAFVVIVGADGGIIGCGGLRPAGDGDVELRKMYLQRDARGRGIGRHLLETLIERARAGGHRRIVLDTASVLVEAIALYRHRGFTPFENPHRVRRCDQSFFLELARR